MIPGGPRIIDVFSGNGAPSGPHCLLFSDVDRRPASLWDRSGFGWSPTPHAPVLGAPQRALNPKLGGLWLWPDVWLRELPTCIYRWKRPRMRRRRLHMSCTIPQRSQGDLRTTNRQDSASAAVMAGPSISRIKKNIFFGPQYVSHWSLWTINERNDTRRALYPLLSFLRQRG